MKKMMIMMMVLMAAGAVVFAQGVRDQAGAPDAGQGLRLEREEVAVTGTLQVTDTGVVIETAEGTFSLSAPRSQYMDIDSYAGTEVTVTGLTVDSELCDGDCPDGYDGHIFVATAEVGGEVIELDTIAGRGGAFGNVGGYYMQDGPAAAGRGAAGKASDRFGGYTQNQPAPRGGMNPRGGMAPRGGMNPRGGMAPQGYGQNGVI